MKRRTLVTGIGTSVLGSVAVVGSGAVSRIETQRQTTIQVAKDPDAYLGLEECPDENDDDEITIEFDDKGHLEIEIEPPASNVSWFDNVFQICNQGKDPASIWIEAKDDLGLPDPNWDGDRLWFYETGLRTEDARVDSVDDAFRLEVGNCKCIGIRVDAQDLQETEQFEGEIVIHADVDVDVDEEPELE